MPNTIFREGEKNSSVVHRPWGSYEVLVEETRYKVKKIVVFPNSRLSMQSHYHRSEHWVVVLGVAKVTLDEKEIILKENESTFIPVYATHRLENIGKINLEMIEVQTGSYIGEDDIVRYEDDYNREVVGKL